MIKEFLINLKHHPYMATFFFMLSALAKWLIESLIVDGLAYILLFVMIGIDTYTGVKLAKQNGTFNYKELKEKTAKKVLGQIIILCGVWTFLTMLFIWNFMAGEKGLVNFHLLNIPMLTALLFYAGVEFLSIKDKVKQLYGVIAPISVVDKVESLVNAGGGDIEKLLKQN